MQQFRPSLSRWTGRILALLLALTVLVALAPRQAFAVEPAEDAGYADSITLPLEETDAPGYDPNLLDLLSGAQYYLLLDGKVLVTAGRQDQLVDLVRTAAERYVTENTISCSLVNQNQIRLCLGHVPGDANTDLEAAAEELEARLLVTTVERTVREVSLPYRTIQQEDETRYTDEEPVVTPGTEGRSRLTEEVTCQNGQVQSTTVVDSQVLEAPVDEIVTVGAKERPEYIWPANGRISSKFGKRNIAVGSSNHKGIDIAVSHGSDIVAAKEGTVIYAQWNSSGYGNLVKIEHEDGDVTYYAHNSSLLVKEGEHVEQGQVIAKAGSTGRSSGTHCHFEIRMDGTPVNPLDYLA